MRQALTADELTVYGDGTQTRCFVHVQDTVAALIELIEHDAAVGRAFNVGNPQPISIAALAERVLARTGSRSRVSLVPYELAYDDGFEELGKREPDIGAINELTGWAPRRSLDQALDDVISFERAQLAELGDARQWSRTAVS